jgi:hypothetical protein
MAAKVANHEDCSQHVARTNSDGGVQNRGSVQENVRKPESHQGMAIESLMRPNYEIEI